MHGFNQSHDDPMKGGLSFLLLSRSERLSHCSKPTQLRYMAKLGFDPTSHTFLITLQHTPGLEKERAMDFSKTEEEGKKKKR